MLKKIYNYKFIIFDFDGVIVDSVKIKEEIYCELFSQISTSELEDIKKYIRNNSHISREEKIQYIYKNISKNNLKSLEELTKLFPIILFSKLKKIKPIKDIKKFLNLLNSSRKIIISAAPRSEIIKIIKDNNLEAYFDEIYGSIKEKHLVIKEFNKSGIQKKQMIFIGDKLSDFNSAEKAGIDFIGRVSEFDPTSFPLETLTFKEFNEFI